MIYNRAKARTEFFFTVVRYAYVPTPTQMYRLVDDSCENEVKSKDSALLLSELDDLTKLLATYVDLDLTKDPAADDVSEPSDSNADNNGTGGSGTDGDGSGSDGDGSGSGDNDGSGTDGDGSGSGDNDGSGSDGDGSGSDGDGSGSDGDGSGSDGDGSGSDGDGDGSTTNPDVKKPDDDDKPENPNQISYNDLDKMLDKMKNAFNGWVNNAAKT